MDCNETSAASAAGQGLDLIWGAKAIGDEIGRSPRQTFYLLETGALPARKVGNLWVASRDALRRHLVGEAA